MSDVVVRPVNLEAERYVLGACMLSPDALDEVSEILRSSDFFDPRHPTIFAALRRLHDDGKPTDVVALEDELIRVKALVGTLDVVYLHELQASVPTAANAGHYAGIVSKVAQRRHLIEAGESIVLRAADASLDAADALEQARELLDTVDATTSHTVEAIGDWYLDYLNSLTQKPAYTPTPWYDLNQMIYGFRDGGFYVIAADTGVGKTVVALQIAMALAEQRPVLYVSLEMGKEEIAGRLTSQTAQVFLGSLNESKLTKSDWKAISERRSEISALPFVIVSSDEVATVPQLKATVRAVARKYKRNPVVVVDYLQLLSSPGPVENRQQEVAGFSRSLKLAAQQWKVPVIALSQLRRAQAGQQKAREPQVSDLRESGQIANDADVVLLLHRKQLTGRADELKVIVGKNRQGRTGEATLVFHGQFSRVLSKYDARPDLINEQGGFS